MRWSRYWTKRAHQAVERRRRRYGVDAPAPVRAILEQERTGFWDSWRLALYVSLRSPAQRLRMLLRHLADVDTPQRNRRIENHAAVLRARLGGEPRILIRYFERRNYSRDLAAVPTPIARMLLRTTPLLVLQPRHEEDVVGVLGFAAEKRLAVFPRGSGTAAFGGCVPTRNGIVVDFSPLARVLEVDAPRCLVRVQPGTRWAELIRQLEPHGLVPITTPTGLFSTIAGWISTGGFGLGSYAYGHLSRAVASLRVVRANGRIEVLEGSTQALRELCGTEGQLALITEVTLRVRPRPAFSAPALLSFDSLEEALALVGTLPQGAEGPAHVVLFDRSRMATENALLQDRLPSVGPLLPERDTLLLHFEQNTALAELRDRSPALAAELDRHGKAAAYLWSERYFPLKEQRIGPSLLGAELLLPWERVATFVVEVEQLGGAFAAEPAIEVIACDQARLCGLVIVSLPCDRSRALHYFSRLVLVQLLTQAGVRQGGHPYGIGIWNTPFVHSKYDHQALADLAKRKESVDPAGTLSPGKFFGLEGRFRGLATLPLRPRLFASLLGLTRRLAPILGPISKALDPPRKETWDPPDREHAAAALLRETALRCTSCGACIPTCPAYLLTADELVTGRTKLRLAEALIEEVEVDQGEAHAAFQCLRCGLCEEVCQTHLPLREAYLVLEAELERRFGPATAGIQSFLLRAEAERETILETYGLDRADWRAPDPHPGDAP